MNVVYLLFRILQTVVNALVIMAGLALDVIQNVLEMV